MSFFNFLTRQSGLNSLANLDDARLSDLGLNRYDLNAARGKGAATASFLSSRRNERAASWLR